MREPTIQADQNLLVNGDFSNSLRFWTKGALNKPWTGVTHGSYLGAEISYLRTGNRSSAYQIIVAPKTMIADVRYELCFLYETNHISAGKVILTVEGTAQRQEIELPGEAASVIEARRLLHAAGQRLELDLKLLRTQLELELKQGQELRVEVCSPPNETWDEFSDIRTTRFELLLQLPPLQLQELKIDDESLSPGGRLYLCLGADFDSVSEGHRLRLSPEQGSDWLGTQAALTIHNNPQGAILARPDWQTDQPLTGEWQLSCPLIGDAEPYLFNLELRNQYTAQPYPLEVSLGHHRLLISNALEAAYYPVLEYGQSVRLGVQVTSHYTAQTLNGRTVNWTDEKGRLRAAVNTGDDGWAYFDYLPDSPGEFTILASVESLYYQSATVTRAFAVKVLATDPWHEVTDAEGAPWQEKTGYPNRGTSYSLQVRVPTVLQGTSLSLGWSGDSPEQLGVIVSPPLGEPMPVGTADPLWTLASEDRLDGVFHLQLSCSKLKLPSARKTMSLARNVVKIGEVREANKFPIVDELESVLLRVQVLHDVALGNGDPVINAQVQWLLPDAGTHSVMTGAGGWASVLYTPEFAGIKTITAFVRAHAEAPPVQRSFTVNALATSPWAGQVRISLDDVEVDRKVLGLLCWRGDSHTLKIEAMPGSTLIGKNIFLNWRGADPNLGLHVTDLEIARPLPEVGGLTWMLNSDATESLSGLFDLKLSSPGISERELFGRLIADDVSEEMSVVLDQTVAMVGDVLHPCLGARHHYSVRPNELGPLIGLEVLLSLPMGQLPPDATVEPALDVAQTLTDGGAIWTFDFSRSVVAETIELDIEMQALKKPALRNVMNLDHNRFKFLLPESPVDPVIGQAPAWLWARVTSHYTGAPVANVPVHWNAALSSGTDIDGWSKFAFEPQTAGAHTLSASVASPYDGYEQNLSTSILALASDPWADVKVRFDGGNAHLLGEKTAFPRRKGQHRFELFASQGNSLIGRQLTLGMTGTGPAELGLAFPPGKALGTPVVFPPEGLAFPFVVGDKRDGSFSLRLAAERLVSLSPANAMSVGLASPVLKFANQTRARQVLDWNQELVEQVTLISAISGKPMVGIEVTWTHAEIGTTTCLTDFYGVARLRFIPRTPGDSVLTATVGDEGFSQSVGLEFTLNEPRQIFSLTTLGHTGYPGQVMSAKAVVRGLTGQPLPQVEVMWVYDGVRLTSTLTDAEGVASLEFTLGVPGESVVEAMVKGGGAGWDTKSVVVEVMEDEVRLDVLSIDKTSVYQGDSVAAIATAVYSRNGYAAKGLQMSWEFSKMTLLPSVTDDGGQARLEFKPMTLGTSNLTARVEHGERSMVQAITVRDPESSPDHARVERVEVARNPIGLHDFVIVKAFVVGTVSDAPMTGRDVEVITNFMPPTTMRTDRDGKVEVIRQPMQTGTLELRFEITNPGGTTTGGWASVQVI